MFGADGRENVPHRNWLILFYEVVEEVKEEMRQQGRPDDFIGGKVCGLSKSSPVSDGADRLYILRSNPSPQRRWTGTLKIVSP